MQAYIWTTTSIAAEIERLVYNGATSKDIKIEFLIRMLLHYPKLTPTNDDDRITKLYKYYLLYNGYASYTLSALSANGIKDINSSNFDDLLDMHLPSDPELVCLASFVRYGELYHPIYVMPVRFHDFHYNLRINKHKHHGRHRYARRDTRHYRRFRYVYYISRNEP